MKRSYRIRRVYIFCENVWGFSEKGTTKSDTQKHKCQFHHSISQTVTLYPLLIRAPGQLPYNLVPIVKKRFRSTVSSDSFHKEVILCPVPQCITVRYRKGIGHICSTREKLHGPPPEHGTAKIVVLVYHKSKARAKIVFCCLYAAEFKYFFFGRTQQRRIAIVALPSASFDVKKDRYWVIHILINCFAMIYFFISALMIWYISAFQQGTGCRWIYSLIQIYGQSSMYPQRHHIPFTCISRNMLCLHSNINFRLSIQMCISFMSAPNTDMDRSPHQYWRGAWC